MRRKRAVVGVLVLGLIGLGGLWLTADGGVPLWWHLRGSDVDRIVLRWSGQRLELTDPAEIARFSQAVRAAPYDLPYQTCTPSRSPRHFNEDLAVNAMLAK